MPSLTPTSARQGFEGGGGLFIVIAQGQQRLQDVGAFGCSWQRSDLRRCGIAEFALELQQQALGGFFADTGHLHQAAHLLQTDGLGQIIRAQAREDGQGGARPRRR